MFYMIYYFFLDTSFEHVLKASLNSKYDIFVISTTLIKTKHFIKSVKSEYYTRTEVIIIFGRIKKIDIIFNLSFDSGNLQMVTKL